MKYFASLKTYFSQFLIGFKTVLLRSEPDQNFVLPYQILHLNLVHGAGPALIFFKSFELAVCAAQQRVWIGLLQNLFWSVSITKDLVLSIL